ncbi:hypothetical protein FOZ61_009509 [Perkinsus olseni]|uniref:protein-serine/threonine phosphatase n=1 Tax=Perkinsus olseni TaxID=32597 RepID=A0A7J6MGV9_PEROL|nr:hypothetical protein FOZ61_009509 [Perkinsus olseni]KAF4676150.1 hypothetical protein FOL46_007202 [Perkinsus olseni]
MANRLPVDDLKQELLAWYLSSLKLSVIPNPASPSDFDIGSPIVTSSEPDFHLPDGTPDDGKATPQPAEETESPSPTPPTPSESDQSPPVAQLSQDAESAKKLALVLDLDHTLVNAVPQPPTMPRYPDRVVEALGIDLHQTELPMQTGKEPHFVKLRPGVHEFLEALQPMYEFYIHTKATRVYLEYVMEALDPHKKGFFRSDNVFSRCDDMKHGSNENKDIRAVCSRPREEVIILDDKDKIWLDFQPNVIKCPPYKYMDQKLLQVVRALKLTSDWLKDGGQASGNPKPELDDASKNFDGYLPAMVRVFTDIHHRYCNALAEAAADGFVVDVKNIIDDTRKQTFKNCRIMLTGFNQNEASERAEMIEMYGGTVINNLEDGPTHLVCAKGGTAKCHLVAKAMKEESLKCKIVHPCWLDHGFATWKHPSEFIFEIGKFTADPRTGQYPVMDHFFVKYLADTHEKMEERAHRKRRGATNANNATNQHQQEPPVSDV